MKTLTAFLACLVTAGLTHCVWAEEVIPQLDREKLPGRPVKVAEICIGFGGEHDVKLKLALEHLHTAGKKGVDIACLPEEFAGTDPEPVPGPTTKAVAKLARKYHMYVICPLREQAGDEQYNTAVLIDRKGEVAGYYRKVFVFWGEGLHLSREGVKAFDTDFGRISILTCFDLNFAELWRQCDALDVDIVFWPSAYGGGSPLNAYATLYHYTIVPVGAGNIIESIASISRSDPNAVSCWNEQVQCMGLGSGRANRHWPSGKCLHELSGPGVLNWKGQGDGHGVVIEVLDDAVARCERAKRMICDACGAVKHGAAECLPKNRKSRFLHFKQTQGPGAEQDLAHGVEVRLVVGVCVEQHDATFRRFVCFQKSILLMA